MVKKIYIVLLTALCLSSAAFAQPFEVRAKTDKKEYKVGDYITYSIIVVHNGNLKLTAPSIKDSLKGAELIRNYAVSKEEKEGKTITKFDYVVSVYDSADITIPPIPVLYTQKGKAKEKALTNSVSFAVRTLKVEAETDIRDVKEPIRIPLDWKTVLLWVLIVLIIAGLIVYGIIYYRKKKAVKTGQAVYIRKEPHETALDALAYLESRKLWQSGKVKEYHSEITDIIRRYFEERFNIPALEMTTAELTEKLASLSSAAAVAGVCSDFLNNADLVKFAKFVPMDSVNEEMMQQAYSIVRSTIPASEPAATGQEEKDVH